MLLSIIIPVYNSDKYLKKCIDSCLCQDVDFMDYEIICIDDGSTDYSGNILDSYKFKTPNFTVIHKENSGVSSSRNCGLNYAKGRYIWFIDSDDYILPNSLSVIKDCLINNNIDMLEIGAYEFIEDTNDKMIADASIKLKAHDSWLWGHIFRRELIFDHNVRFSENIDFAEDMLFEFEIQHYYPNLIRKKIEERIYFYRYNTNGLSKKTTPKRLDSFINLTNTMLKYKNDNSHDRLEAEYFATLYYYRAISSIIRLANPERKLYINKLKQLEKFTPSKSTIDRFKSTQPNTSIRNFRWAPTRFGYFMLKFLLWFKHIKGVFTVR